MVETEPGYASKDTFHGFGEKGGRRVKRKLNVSRLYIGSYLQAV